MDPPDALCSNTFARSVAELRLAPAYWRGWCSVLGAIGGFFTRRVIYREEAERADRSDHHRIGRVPDQV